MPEEPLQSVDIDREGSAPAQMLTFQAAQRAEKQLAEVHEAFRGIIDAKNRRIDKLIEVIEDRDSTILDLQAALDRALGRV